MFTLKVGWNNIRKLCCFTDECGSVWEISFSLFKKRNIITEIFFCIFFMEHNLKTKITCIMDLCRLFVYIATI